MLGNTEWLNEGNLTDLKKSFLGLKQDMSERKKTASK